MSWAEQRRADRAAAAEQARLDADAASARRIREREALAEQARRDEQARTQQRQAERAERRARRDAKRAALRAWAASHTVDLLIYPAVLVAFAMAGPSMAAYGAEVYGSALGWLLPGISELLMLAFAVAVLIARRTDPARPVAMLQAGVWVFAALSAGLNFLHGLDQGWSAGVVMAIVAVSGIVAHQLTLATPPRPAAERAAARIARREARKVARVRRAAVRHAVAEIDADGTARLVYTPGRYVLTGRRGRRLEAAIVPGLPVDQDPTKVVDWDTALADLLTHEQPAGIADRDAGAGESTLFRGSSVDTLDRDADQPKSSPDRGRIGGRVGRSIEQLRAELRAAIEADPHAVDPTSAESIRKTLRCSPRRARQLRDEHRGGHQ
ncbi:hypothetical protein [Prauserella muralis]|uniref:Uncharacterized protein n=1 Tax=Prauserella muralis TaxID=588067 RepID=A0A2V4B8E1_9PSEU|nr:hypothetical protein [Prauserella muralis]PXY31685.1 hypothetical protein BAY60_04805 [Prauserella muralis]TWE13938.1 hypothetical protein FHX69_6071 [Prauserella muralis]